jgi:hypothetical protein
MNYMIEFLVNFLFVIPVLFFISICILTNQQPKGFLISVLLILCLTLIIGFHFVRILELFEKIKRGEPLEKEYGYFILFFASFLLFSNIRNIFV